jgi:hypothetical protein
MVIIIFLKPRYPHYSKLSEEDLRKYNPPLFNADWSKKKKNNLGALNDLK